MQFSVRSSLLIIAITGFIVNPTTGLAQPSTSGWKLPLDPPGPQEFILDHANLISAADKEQIRTVAGELLSERATPIIVVTIDSMANHGGTGLRIETFARLLFDQWGIGYEKYGNKGVLLLIARDDRRARIELGAGWKHEKDDVAQRIMDDYILTNFKVGAYSEGILIGVENLGKMIRNETIPRPPRPAWHYAVIVGFVGLAVFTFVSLVRRGSSGWAWLMWAAIFSLTGTVLYHVLTNSGNSSSGGFSGGSFGGGFSGGGGASGSW